MMEGLGASLLRALEQAPDPRSRHGRRHPLSAVLVLSVLAMACGARSLYAIAQWGRTRDSELLKALGFTREKTPSVSTLHKLFKRLEVDEFERGLEEWFVSMLGEEQEGIAIDGKALKGIHGDELPGVRLVSMYSRRLLLVVGQKGGP